MTLELDGVLVAKTPENFWCKTNTLQMLDFHKIEGAPEVLEGNEFKLNWTKAELTVYLKILILKILVHYRKFIIQKGWWSFICSNL